MLSEAQRARVWEGWLSAETRAYYFGDLGGSYVVRQRAVTWIALFFSSGAVVASLAKLPGELLWLAAALPAVAAGASLYLVATQANKVASDSAELHQRWQRIASDYRTLWEHPEDPDADTKIEALAVREAEASKPGTLLPHDERRMLKWETLVLAQRAPHASAAA